MSDLPAEPPSGSRLPGAREPYGAAIARPGIRSVRAEVVKLEHHPPDVGRNHADPPPNTREERKPLVILQAFRGLAALYVVLFHVNVWLRLKLGALTFFGLFSEGRVGVDFFFVLSGFIIMHAHGRDIGRPERLSAYAFKRLLRIYPVYWLVLLPLLPIYFLVPAFGVGYERAPDVIIRSLLLLPQAHPPILTVAWSLVQEMVFYTLFASLIAFGAYALPGLVTWLLGCLVVGAWYYPNPGQTAADYLPNVLFGPYNLEFVAGAIAAYAFSRVARPRWGALLTTLGIMLALACVGAAHMSGPFTGPYLAIGAAFTVLVFGTALMEKTRTLRVPRLFRLLGDASYTIYLVHFPLIALAGKFAVAIAPRSGIPPAISLAVALPAILYVGCMLHLRVEKPLLAAGRAWFERRQKRNPRSRPVDRGGVAA